MNNNHLPMAAEQATARLLHALRSLASVAIWSACIGESWGMANDGEWRT